MKFSLAAIVALSAAVDRVSSFSYMNVLSGGQQTPPNCFASTSSLQASQAPFFFTNNGVDEPVNNPAAGANSPPFFFTNGHEEHPAVPITTNTQPLPAEPVAEIAADTTVAAANSGSYLNNLGGSGGAPVAGAGLGSYLDVLGSGTSSISGGPGISSYANTLSTSNYSPMGGGMPSYSESLDSAAASAFTSNPPPPVDAAQPITPPADASFSPVEEITSPAGGAAANSMSYLSALGDGSSSSMNGAGLTSYLDVLPRQDVVGGGSGISSYAASLSNNVNAGGDPAFYSEPPSFVDAAAAATPEATTSGTEGYENGTFDFTIEAGDEFVRQLIEAGERRKVIITGSVNNPNQ